MLASQSNNSFFLCHQNGIEMNIFFTWKKIHPSVTGNRKLKPRGCTTKHPHAMLLSQKIHPTLRFVFEKV